MTLNYSLTSAIKIGFLIFFMLTFHSLRERFFQNFLENFFQLSFDTQCRIKKKCFLDFYMGLCLIKACCSSTDDPSVSLMVFRSTWLQQSPVSFSASRFCLLELSWLMDNLAGYYPQLIGWILAEEVEDLSLDVLFLERLLSYLLAGIPQLFPYLAISAPGPSILDSRSYNYSGPDCIMMAPESIETDSILFKNRPSYELLPHSGSILKLEYSQLGVISLSVPCIASFHPINYTVYRFSPNKFIKNHPLKVLLQRTLKVLFENIVQSQHVKPSSSIKSGFMFYLSPNTTLTIFSELTHISLDSHPKSSGKLVFALRAGITEAFEVIIKIAIPTMSFKLKQQTILIRLPTKNQYQLCLHFQLSYIDHI